MRERKSNAEYHIPKVELQYFMKIFPWIQGKILRLFKNNFFSTSCISFLQNLQLRTYTPVIGINFALIVLLISTCSPMRKLISRIISARHISTALTDILHNNRRCSLSCAVATIFLPLTKITHKLVFVLVLSIATRPCLIGRKRRKNRRRRISVTTRRKKGGKKNKQTAGWSRSLSALSTPARVSLERKRERERE